MYFFVLVLVLSQQCWLLLVVCVFLRAGSAFTPSFLVRACGVYVCVPGLRLPRQSLQGHLLSFFARRC